jgi:hypothetical protein
MLFKAYPHELTVNKNITIQITGRITVVIVFTKENAEKQRLPATGVAFFFQPALAAFTP